jgi:glycosyltransferase involved in cell wall biosynthesis
MNKTNLLIVIPTYNRQQQLVTTLLSLIPQLSENSHILIIDNNSTPSVTDYLNELSLTHSKISIIKNRINIGGDANIMKCLSYSTDEWIWLLGDDDRISNNAIETIQKTIEMLDNEISAIKFSSPCGQNPQNKVMTKANIRSFEPSREFISNLLFISSTVINRSHIKFEGSLESLTSMASQVVLLFNQTNAKKIYFSRDVIIDHIESGNWSWAELEGKMIHAFKYIIDEQPDTVNLFLSSVLNLRISSTKLLIRVSRVRKNRGGYVASNLYRNAILSRHYIITKFNMLFLTDHIFYIFFILKIDIPLLSILSYIHKMGIIKKYQPLST